MKRLFCISAMIALIGCDRQPAEFNGLGGIDLGADFSSIADSKSFTKIMENEYFITDYEMGDGIGPVSRLSVTTNQSGKIIAAKFLQDERTDYGQIEKRVAGLTAFNVPFKVPAGTDFKIFVNADTTVLLSKVKSGHKVFSSGLPRWEYGYSNKEYNEQKRRMAQELFPKSKRAK
ncbi:hypothetical protein [Flavobacterium selenitireducens]|uniref:hypothetical protein n=1 Tax=Flavobacterium selenitireducens TaxID=2722704 RepID=UPI00168B6EF7|nr:hypothetical protein [Flavobacterium selenitireducens]MBD3582580.1 hypothetical protein [Flavobacterium selenitireducens]